MKEGAMLLTASFQARHTRRSRVVTEANCRSIISRSHSAENMARDWESVLSGLGRCGEPMMNEKMLDHISNGALSMAEDLIFLVVSSRKKNGKGLFLKVVGLVRSRSRTR